MSEDNFALSDVPESSLPLGITLTDTSLRDKTWLYSALTIAPTGATITYFLCEDLQEQYPVTLGQLARELALYSEYQRYSQHTSMRADARLEFFNRGMLELFVVDVIEPRYKDYAINHLMNLGKHAPRTYTFDQLFTEPLNDSIAPGSVEALYALPIQDSFEWPVLDPAFIKALPPLQQVGA
jgi:hypothetical protein